MPTESEAVVEGIAGVRRVLVLGGLAVIAHGKTRTTLDSDIWLDPSGSLEEWCDLVRSRLALFPDHYLFDVFHRDRVPAEGLERTIEEVGMIRVGGLDRYLDIFHTPHSLDPGEFDAAWNASTLALGSARIMDEAYLITTKIETGRDTDREDVSFLEAKLRSTHCPRLRACSLAEARALTARYVDHATALAATENPDPAVRALGLDLLRELAAGQNPFAIEALRRLGAG